MNGRIGTTWLALNLGVLACDSGPQFSASVTRMATVGLESGDTIVVNAPISVDLQGTLRTDLEVELELTVTASSADVAEAEAKRIEIAVSRRDREIIFGIGGIDPDRVQRVSGTYTVIGPIDLDARVVSGGSSVSVDGLEGDITIETVADARVIGAEGNVTVEVGTGNAIVDTRALAGTTTDVFVQSGSVELRLPSPLNARVVAAATGGALVVNHSELPRPLPGLAYDVVVRSGLATVAAVTRSGNVVLRQR